MPLTFHRLLKICGHLKKGGGGGGGGMEDFFSECRVKSYWITALKVNDRPLAEWMSVRGGGTLCSSSMAVMHRKLALFYIALNAALPFLYPPPPPTPHRRPERVGNYKVIKHSMTIQFFCCREVAHKFDFTLQMWFIVGTACRSSLSGCAEEGPPSANALGLLKTQNFTKV